MSRDEAPTRDRQGGPAGMDGRATIVFGVGAIIGGGIIVLAGPSLVAAGPATLLAVLLNAVVAVAAAFSLSELATRFPRSGGPYAFALQVFSIQTAFAVGWLVWFASLAAAAVFALGFAEFALAAAAELARGIGPGPVAWATSRAPTVLVALAAVAVYLVQLLRRRQVGGAWLIGAKVFTMAALGLAGMVAVALAPGAASAAAARFATDSAAFAPHGAAGVAQAMGLLFVAFQGFALLAAAAGEIERPVRDVPRAMLIAIAVATLLYLPLFVAILAVGIPAGETLGGFAARTGGTTLAEAARTYLGPAGFWLVTVTAVLAMLTALQANLYAASRVARAMARDRTLPLPLARLGPDGTPRWALLTSAGLVAAIVVTLPTVATAGSAAGLIYLSVFALAHAMALLARRRASEAAPFRAPLGTWLPLLGGLGTLALAVINAVAVPSAGLLALGWLALGALAYAWLLGRQAAAVDAEHEATEPDLVRLRGRRPLVLVPVANPSNAEALVSVAHALAPPTIGRVLLLTVVSRSPDEDPEPHVENAQRVLRASLGTALALGLEPEAMTAVAGDPWEAITRVARTHACEVVLLGLSRLDDAATLARVDRLLADVGSDVVILRAPPGWHLERVRDVVVPFAGGAQQETLRARVLGALARLADPRVRYVQVLPSAASERARLRAERALRHVLEGRSLGRTEGLCVRSDDPVAAVAATAATADLLLLGLPRRDTAGAALGSFAPPLLASLPPSCAALLIHRRG
jgi:basic amino acid/polyamine antiporter, APA family